MKFQWILIRVISLGGMISMCLNICCAQNSNSIKTILSSLDSLEKEYSLAKGKLYEDMISINKIEAKRKLGHFVHKENIYFLLDSIGYKVISVDPLDGGDWIYPYYEAIFILTNKSDAGFWHIMPFLFKVLDEKRNLEEMTLYADLFKRCFSIGGLKTASCLRNMANSIRGKSQQKQNLLKIAQMIENR